MPTSFDLVPYKADYNPIAGGPFVSIQDVMGAFGDVFQEVIALLPQLVSLLDALNPSQIIQMLETGLTEFLDLIFPPDGSTSPLITAVLNALLGSNSGGIGNLFPQLFNLAEQILTSVGGLLFGFLPGSNILSQILGVIPGLISGLTGLTGLGSFFTDFLGLLGSPTALGSGSPILGAITAIPLFGPLASEFITFINPLVGGVFGGSNPFSFGFSILTDVIGLLGGTGITGLGTGSPILPLLTNIPIFGQLATMFLNFVDPFIIGGLGSGNPFTMGFSILTDVIGLLGGTGIAGLGTGAPILPGLTSIPIFGQLASIFLNFVNPLVGGGFLGNPFTMGFSILTDALGLLGGTGITGLGTGSPILPGISSIPLFGPLATIFLNFVNPLVGGGFLGDPFSMAFSIFNDVIGLLGPIVGLGTGSPVLSGLLSSIPLFGPLLSGALSGGGLPLNVLNLFGIIPGNLFGVLPIGALTNATPNLFTNAKSPHKKSFIFSDSLWTWDSTKSQASDGTGSSKGTANGTLQALRSNPIAVSPGQSLSVGIYALWASLAYTGTPIEMGLVTYSGGAQTGYTSLANIASPAASGGWQQMTANYTVPSGVDSVRMRLVINAAATAGNVWYDGASFTQTGLVQQGWVNNLVSQFTGVANLFGLGGIANLISPNIATSWANIAETILSPTQWFQDLQAILGFPAGLGSGSPILAAVGLIPVLGPLIDHFISIFGGSGSGLSVFNSVFSDFLGLFGTPTGLGSGSPTLPVIGSIPILGPVATKFISMLGGTGTGFTGLTSVFADFMGIFGGLGGLGSGTVTFPALTATPFLTPVQTIVDTIYQAASGLTGTNNPINNITTALQNFLPTNVLGISGPASVHDEFQNLFNQLVNGLNNATGHTGQSPALVATAAAGLAGSVSDHSNQIAALWTAVNSLGGGSGSGSGGGSGAGLPSTTTMNSSGTYSIPSGALYVDVYPLGGGAGGQDGGFVPGAGGGAGQWGGSTLNVSGQTSMTVSIGSGGTHGSTPTDGGATSASCTGFVASGAGGTHHTSGSYVGAGAGNSVGGYGGSAQNNYGGAGSAPGGGGAGGTYFSAGGNGAAGTCILIARAS